MSLQEHEICLLRICFALFLANCVFKHFVAQTVDLFSSVFKKIIPDGTTPTFQKVGGIIQPIFVCRRHLIFSWFRVNHYIIN